MPSFTIMLTDAQDAAIKRCVATSFKTPEVWLRAQVAALAKQCVDAVRDDDLRKVGVSCLADLTPVELKTITDARKRT